jgi:hypothetical protein
VTNEHCGEVESAHPSKTAKGGAAYFWWLRQNKRCAGPLGVLGVTNERCGEVESAHPSKTAKGGQPILGGFGKTIRCASSQRFLTLRHPPM